ncbi:uncharacterized protein TNIN_172831 [Trichonephila inaurata madagascariensis]|uniref:Uncharacterized protein n=1 Tax=Trichonephila inaurata madagascariensis TaxID=2747483 RepID=A0A8X6XZD4_9ARAC|nr:uncharacterized protein TNIN_172831 [Trichonephila inaurata madagascariensis]
MRCRSSCTLLRLRYSDYTSWQYGSSECIFEALDPMGHELERTLATLEKFICHVYGVSNSSNVNDAHFYLFSKTYQSKKSDDNFEKKCRSFDSSSLPACKAELYQYLLRVRTNTTRKAKHNNDFDDDGIDNNGSSYDDVDYGDALVFCNTIKK